MALRGSILLFVALIGVLDIGAAGASCSELRSAVLVPAEFRNRGKC